MEIKINLVQAYAIIVLAVSVVLFIISVSVMASALVDRSNPLAAGYSKTDLSSFQAYKMEVMKSVEEEDANIPDDAAIREMYDAAKQEKIDRVMHRTRRDALVSGLLMLVSVILFASHWYIMKRSARAEE